MLKVYFTLVRELSNPCACDSDGADVKHVFVTDILIKSYLKIN